MNKNIVLTGMRGSGKTEIGKYLAELLKRNFIDIDTEIKKHIGRKINEFVKKEGWEKFREIERTITKKTAEKKNVVISTGGGTIIDPENEIVLKKNGFVIFLYCDINVLGNRILNSEKRPSLTGKPVLKEIDDVWEKRKKRYEKTADLIFDTSDTEKPSKKAEKILSLLP